VIGAWLAVLFIAICRLTHRPAFRRSPLAGRVFFTGPRPCFHPRTSVFCNRVLLRRLGRLPRGTCYSSAGTGYGPSGGGSALEFTGVPSAPDPWKRLFISPRPPPRRAENGIGPAQPASAVNSFRVARGSGQNCFGLFFGRIAWPFDPVQRPILVGSHGRGVCGQSYLDEPTLLQTKLSSQLDKLIDYLWTFLGAPRSGPFCGP